MTKREILADKYLRSVLSDRIIGILIQIYPDEMAPVIESLQDRLSRPNTAIRVET